MNDNDRQHSSCQFFWTATWPTEGHMTLFVLYGNWCMDHCTCHSYECLFMKLSVTTAMVHHGSPKSPGGSPWSIKPANIRFHEENWFMEQAVFRWCGSLTTARPWGRTTTGVRVACSLGLRNGTYAGGGRPSSRTRMRYCAPNPQVVSGTGTRYVVVCHDVCISRAN